MNVFGIGDGGRAARRGWGCDCRARQPISSESDDEAGAGEIAVADGVGGSEQADFNFAIWGFSAFITIKH